MKRLLFIFLASALPFCSLAHKGHTTVFHVSNNGDQLLVKAKLEIRDLQRVLGDDHCKTSNALAFCAAEYATDHFLLVLDGEYVPIHLESSTEKDG